jgi:hypothetical protein
VDSVRRSLVRERKTLERAILATAESPAIAYFPQLLGLYLGMFAFAEAAFALMAMREYLQDLLRLSDVSLIGDETGIIFQAT